MNKVKFISLAIVVTVFIFSCSSDDNNYNSFTDSRDGKSYKMVTIGSQTWMAENLNYNFPGSRCYGDETGGDSLGNCKKYGRLYNWNTAMNNSASSNIIPSGVRGICPAGWHLPSNKEWEVLIIYVGDVLYYDGTFTAVTADKKLKATSGWNSNGNGTDDYGFSALPGGHRHSYNGFEDVGSMGYWWSATGGRSSYYAYCRSGFYVADNADDECDSPELLSVRCLQDYD